MVLSISISYILNNCGTTLYTIAKGTFTSYYRYRFHEIEPTFFMSKFMVFFHMPRTEGIIMATFEFTGSGSIIVNANECNVFFINC